MSDITLTSSIRKNLLSLQNASKLLDTTSERLSTGKKVNSALDNPSSFFTARGLTNRASDLTGRKDGLGQAISLLQATDKSITSITTLVDQAKATAQAAEEASTAGITSLTSASASFVGTGETGVATLSTEAIAATTANTSALSIKGQTGTIVNTSSTLTQMTGAGVADASTLIFTLQLDQGQTIPAGTAGTSTINGASTITQTLTALNALTGVTAAFNTATGAIDITGIGGLELGFTGTSKYSADTGLNVVATDGTATATTSLIASAGTATFNTTGTSADLAAAAFGLTDANATDVIFTIDGTATAAIVTDFLTVDALANTISALSADITATFNATTKKIDITGNNGTVIQLNGTTATEFGITENGGATALRTGIDYAVTDGTAPPVTALLTEILDGSLVNDTLTFGVTGGSSGTAFSVTSTSTIQDMVDAINASDSSLTATYNTTTGKIAITAADGTAVTVTSGGTTGLFAAAGFTSDGTTALVSGTAVTLGAKGTASEVASLNSDFQSILENIDSLIKDASFKGINLLSGSNSSIVKFNADGSSALTIEGLDIGVTNNVNFNFTRDASGYDFTAAGDIGQALTDTAAAVTQLRSIASTFGTDMGVIQAREDFTSELVNVLESGAGKLINANLEEESANMLALQTRQALGIQALSISNQSNQSILSLFR
jgi:flagellin-like hook-associated protein FlgL